MVSICFIDCINASHNSWILLAMRFWLWDAISGRHLCWFEGCFGFVNSASRKKSFLRMHNYFIDHSILLVWRCGTNRNRHLSITFINRSFSRLFSEASNILPICKQSDMQLCAQLFWAVKTDFQKNINIWAIPILLRIQWCDLLVGCGNTIQSTNGIYSTKFDKISE